MANFSNGAAHHNNNGLKETEIVTKFIKVGKVLTHVTQLGQLDDVPKDNRQRYLMFVIPGNPGVPTFYEDFMKELYHQSGERIPVWAIGHAGHSSAPSDSLTLRDVVSTDEKTFGLEAQIDHKVAFIQEQVPPDVKLILVGHSIGCYMILNLLEKINSSSVLRCFFLFPTIERMAISPNGATHTPVFRFFRWIVVFLALLIVLLPLTIRENLIRLVYRNVDYPACMTPAILTTLTPSTVNFSTYLAKLEMGIVTKLQTDLVRKHLDKLSLYYGASDLWAPVNYYNELRDEFPTIDARLCDLNMKHAFVMARQEGRQMADILWQWLSTRFLPKSDGFGDVDM